MSSDALALQPAVARLAAVLPPGMLPAALHEPEFNGAAKAMLAGCLDSGWVSYAGPQVTEFETALARLCGRAHCVATVSGTAALHAALMVAGVQRDDEVLIPTLTFAATANAVAYCGAIPHLLDSAPDTLGLDPEALALTLSAIAARDGDGLRNRATGRRIAAIVPVHVLGHPSDDARLAEITRSYGVPLVVDATESLGSLRDGRPAAASGDLSVLSFNGNKIITTGGGGAVLTDDARLAGRLRHITTTAKQPHRWEFMHDEIGFNYRMPNLNAALGLAQLAQLDDFVDRKRRLATAYQAACQALGGLSFVAEPRGTRSNYWLNAVMLRDGAQRDALLEALQAAGLMARPLWQLMHRLPMFAHSPRAASLATAEDLQARIVCLPSSPRLATS
jgi:perosamine synthetase